MTDTYTGMFGNSPLGQSQKSLYDAISAIRGMPPSTPAEQGQVSAQAGAMALQKAAPGAIQQNVQQLTQQSGIPQLQAGYGDLSKIFQMYLHDTNLSSKYAAPSMTGYQAGSGVPTQATYNQSPADILAGVTPPPGADGGFSGFTTPSANTAAMGAVPTQSSNIMDLVQKAIGGEQDIVGKNAQLASENYQAAINGLLGLAQEYGQADVKKAQLAHLKAQTQKIYQDMGFDVNNGVDTLNTINDPNSTKLDKLSKINAQIAATSNPSILKKLYNLKKQIQKSGGEIPTGQQKNYDEALTTYIQLKEVSDLMKNPENQKKLKNLFGLKGWVAQKLYGNDWGKFADTTINPQDDPDLYKIMSTMNTLWVARDKQYLGARPAAQLVKMLMPGAATLDKSFAHNKVLIEDAKQRFEKLFDANSQMWGFDNWKDLPGISTEQAMQDQVGSSRQVLMQSPDGKQYMVDQEESNQAMQNGWKKL